MRHRLSALIIGSILLWSDFVRAHGFMVEQYKSLSEFKGLLLIFLLTLLLEYLFNRWVFGKPKHLFFISVAALMLSSLCAALLLPFSSYIVMAIGVPTLLLFVALLSCAFMVAVKLAVYHIAFKLPASNAAFGAIIISSAIATSFWLYLPAYLR